MLFGENQILYCIQFYTVFVKIFVLPFFASGYRSGYGSSIHFGSCSHTERQKVLDPTKSGQDPQHREVITLMVDRFPATESWSKFFLIQGSDHIPAFSRYPSARLGAFSSVPDMMTVTL
jgi:hypothetical protein